MWVMRAVVVILTVVLLAACERPGVQETARARIGPADSAARTPELLEQRVTVDHRTRISRLCLDEDAKRLLADYTRRANAAGGSLATAAPAAPEPIVTSAWRGPCPSGLSPGQMIGPDGRQFQIADLLRSAVR